MYQLAKGLSDWMNGSGPLVILAGSGLAALCAPAVVLAHELGHAMVGLARTDGLVRVRVGRSPERWCIRLGRLQLHLNPWFARNEPAGLASVFGLSGLVTRLALVLAGPLAQAGAASVILFFGLHGRARPVEVAGVVLLADALANLVPRTRGRVRSDGAFLLDALRSAGTRSAPSDPIQPTLAQVYGRWLALYTNEKSGLRTDQRARMLAGAPVGLGYPPGDDGAALFHLAFAGWCWREAERGIPSARLRAAILDALDAAARSGASGTDLTARAALRLAASGLDLGLGSPEDEAAFDRMPIELQPPAIPVEHRRAAFRYGIGLHDVERVQEEPPKTGV